ncbi:MAG: diaminopimelate epimerase [Cyclobacteriaceae bacterium]|nr:diaminopimelate epimerase [Cyclobacteriaceae bacterium]
MKIPFTKYQATGNDFILIDNRSGAFSFSTDQIAQLCDRKFGIGADGLILIEQHPNADFNLNYFNSDGSQGLCGNGSRAGIQFASTLGIISNKTSFNAYDGLHDAELQPSGNIRMRMMDVHEITETGGNFFMNTGSPHLVCFVDDVQHYPVFDEGRKLRYDKQFKEGANVNFVELQPNNTIFMRTYERGVENETLSCGTGATAASLAASRKGYTSPITVKVRGGELSIEFEQSADASTFTNIFLNGPAKKVFEGTFEF